VRPGGGTADHRPAGTISEDIEKCGDTIYLVYNQHVAADRRINGRTLLRSAGFLETPPLWVPLQSALPWNGCQAHFSWGQYGGSLGQRLGSCGSEGMGNAVSSLESITRSGQTPAASTILKNRHNRWILKNLAVFLFLSCARAWQFPIFGLI
jgi:hypothetical protein